MPKATVAIVCFNEEKNIVECLNSLLTGFCRPKEYEILVIDNNSQDGTRKAVREFVKAKKIRLIINKKRGIASSRNIAVKEAKSELLAFIDADCVAPKNWLKNLVQGFEKYKKENRKIVAVGGGNRPPQTTLFYQALGLFLNTFLGSRGSVQGARFLKDKLAPHLPCFNVLFEKKRIIEVGGFDENLGSIIEDEDLTYRLSKKGYQFMYLAGNEVIHKMRSDLISWGKNMFTYGKGRAWFLQKYPERTHFFFLLPIILILGFELLCPFYFSFMFIYSLFLVLRKRKLNLFFYVFSLYLTTHLAYGLGEIYGFLINRYKVKD